MNRNILKTRSARRRQLGQGMTEYIIIVALIAVAAIGVYSAFGHVLKDQVSAVAAAVGGDKNAATTQVADAKANAGNAVKIANEKNGLNTYAKDAGEQ